MEHQPPSYLRHYTDDKWYYNPPADAVKAGVVARVYIKGKEAAFAHAEANNVLVKQYQADKKMLKRLTEQCRVDDLVSAYFASLDFSVLADSSKLNYRKDLNSWLDKRVGGQLMRNIKVNDLTVPMCQRFYEARAGENVYGANNSLRVYRLLFSFAIRMGYSKFNPWSHVKRRSVDKRKVMWDRHYVRAFLNTSFSQWKWRNVGVIFYCLYEWGQRPSDIINLKWDNIDWEARSVTITQRKRKATVKLPISNGLYQLLKQQHDDFGRQAYVAPQMVRRAGKWVPYTLSGLNFIVNNIMDAADIPTELQLRDLRRTAITETVEGGADAVTLMQLSGHQSIHSLQPYIVHTLSGAKKAQSIRDFPDQLMDGVEDDADLLLNGTRKWFKRKSEGVHQ